ncbi:putative RING-H2 finger protein ATL21A [Phragmites australis]|uniref:putative RING-H2 finger protein ATL21A n=1 Tax=Phragmites australis TaxID=29695 RepID=UPI002D795C2C|nr:putative RING-H2 finger protein ATL21A [Phragmites australis]
MTPVACPCSDHSYELPLRRNLLLDLLRFIAGVLLDRLGLVPCQGDMQLPGLLWCGEQVDAAAVERILEAALWAPSSTAIGTRSLTALRYRRRRVAQPADEKGEEDDEGAAVCAICLAGLEAGGCQVAELCSCSHAFHAACIDEWVGSGGAATCPLCRAPMSPTAWDGQSWCNARTGD